MNAQKAEKVEVDLFGTKILIQEVNNPVHDTELLDESFYDPTLWEEGQEDRFCMTCDNQGVVMVCFDDMSVSGAASACTATERNHAPTVEGESINW